MGMVIGAVLGYSGNLEKTIKDPLKQALSQYRDNATATNDPRYAYKNAWNEVQKELKCCGVDNQKGAVLKLGMEMKWMMATKKNADKLARSRIAQNIISKDATQRSRRGLSPTRTLLLGWLLVWLSSCS